MPKLKTNSGARKRFKVTRSKRYKYTRCKRRHLLEAKSAKTSRQMRRAGYVHPSDERRIQQLLPYG